MVVGGTWTVGMSVCECLYGCVYMMSKEPCVFLSCNPKECFSLNSDFFFCLIFLRSYTYYMYSRLFTN